MPTPPRNPLDVFIDNLVTGLTGAAEEASRTFLKDVNREARRVLRQANQAAAREVGPRRRTRAQERPEKGQGPVHPTTPRPVLYDALEVSPKASAETISAAFRSLSARFHPDKHETGDAEKYKAITAAWTVLKDPVKRRAYDRSIGI